MLLILGSPCVIAGTRHLSMRATRVTVVPPKLVGVVAEGVTDVPGATVHARCSADQRRHPSPLHVVLHGSRQCMRGEGDKGGVRCRQCSARGAWHRLYVYLLCCKVVLISQNDLCSTTSSGACVRLHLATQLPMGGIPGSTRLGQAPLQRAEQPVIFGQDTFECLPKEKELVTVQPDPLTGRAFVYDEAAVRDRHQRAHHT